MKFVLDAPGEQVDLDTVKTESDAGKEQTRSLIDDVVEDCPEDKANLNKALDDLIMNSTHKFTPVYRFRQYFYQQHHSQQY